jgi:hypothetical protein
MTDHQTSPRTSITVPQRVAWFVIACAAASLALTTAARVAGGSIRWTSWALPLLCAANAYVLFFGGLHRWPRLARLFWALSLALAGAVIVSEALVFVQR